MRTPVYITVLAVALVAGCGKSSQSTSSTPSSSGSSGVSPLSAPADYVGAMANGQQRALKVVDLASLNQAVQMYNATEGHYPKDLNELIEQKLIVRIPDVPNGMKLDYDPTTGKVTMVSE
ncbi:MAG TPA: hypothetical protein VH413_09380 [Verrucomicrobiae bacterium]|jgi:hypothetical protein|nr:hypothetical protein [Verrucomicrobiae bacterium]